MEALARATINLPGFQAGTLQYVDLEAPYVKDCLRARWIILMPPEKPQEPSPADEGSSLNP